MSTHLILLAAGEGTRMLSARPKVLHEIAGAPILAHALASARDLTGRRVVVVGHGGDAVAEAAKRIDDALETVVQAEQLGTAHAVRMAAPALSGAGGDTLMLYGDTPFIRPETIADMEAARRGGAAVVFLGFHSNQPNRYGRMVADGDRLLRIVEWKEASEEERAITLCNSGVVLGDTETLLGLAGEVGSENDAGEYYLTDIVEMANARGLQVDVVTCDEAETLGINTRADLAQAEAVFQARARQAAMDSGVTLQAPDTVHFAFDTRLGRDTVVEPNVVFGPGVTVEEGATIRAFSHVEGAHIQSGAIIGPYARIRPGTEVAEGAKVGNFVEVKNARIATGAKANHLSYVGDADVGAGANIGAGTIVCNYDGVSKHRTTIGERAFIGSNSSLVAPVTIGDEAMTATGSVISRNVPDGDLAIARARQENKPGFARKLFGKLRAAKKAKG